MSEAMDPDAPTPPPKAKRRKGTSPTARTLAELRKRGWTAQVVERRLPRTFTTVDLFGVIDLIAIVPLSDMAPPRGETLARRGAILGIQATTGEHHANRRTKILAEPRAAEWVAAGGRLELWTWSMTGARGKRKRWTLRCETYAEMRAVADQDRRTGPASEAANQAAVDGAARTRAEFAAADLVDARRREG